MKNNLHVIFGTGPLGLSVMNTLIKKGYNIRMVNRSGKADVPGTVDVVKGELLYGFNITEAVAGASVVYQCASPPYDKWPEQFPRMQNNLINAAASVNAKLVIGENVYMYGDTDGKLITEDLPYGATTRKGNIRAELALRALRLHKEGKLKITIGRASDFFGPFVLLSSMGERQIGFALRGKRASLVGDIDLPHSLTYIKDFGKALVTLAENDAADGEVWHVPNAPALTQREFMTKVFQEIGLPPKMTGMSEFKMKIGGLFIPAARETVEMMYEFKKPFVVNSAKFEERFGWSATPLDAAISETVDWFKNR